MTDAAAGSVGSVWSASAAVGGAVLSPLGAGPWTAWSEVVASAGCVRSSAVGWFACGRGESDRVVIASAEADAVVNACSATAAAWSADCATPLLAAATGATMLVAAEVRLTACSAVALVCSAAVTL